MNYRQNKNKNYKKYIFFSVGAILLLLLLSFGFNNSRGAQTGAWQIFKPLMTFKNNVSTRFGVWGAYFSTKKNLEIENQDLKNKNTELEARLSNYDILLKENEDLKNTLGRKIEKEFVLANVLVKPNRSLYDTMLVDAGTSEGVHTNAKVFAYGDVPLGYVSEVSSRTASIVLYSTSKEITSIVDASTGTELEASGRGAGNFEVILPRDFEVTVGEAVYLPGLPYTLATVQGIISDPRDSFKKALLKSPVNIFDLRFVQIEK